MFSSRFSTLIILLNLLLIVCFFIILKLFPPSDPFREGIQANRQRDKNTDALDNSFCGKLQTIDKKSFEKLMKVLEKQSIKVSENSLVKNVANSSIRTSALKSVTLAENPPSIKSSTNTSHIYCFYGTDESGAYSQAMSHLDLVSPTESWKVKKWRTTIPRAYVAGATIGSKIYLFGGMSNGQTRRNIAEIFDASTEILKHVELLPERLNSAAAAVLNGSIYLTGGWTSNDSIYRNVLRYTIENNQWEKLPTEMNELRAAHQLVELDGRLYAIAGANQQSAEVYDPTIGSWSVIAEPNYAHTWGSAVAHEKKIYVISSKGFEVYSPETQSWNPLKSLKNLYGMALVLADEKLLVMGGAKNYKGVKTVYSYDVATDVWTPEADMEDGRAYHYCGVVKN